MDATTLKEKTNNIIKEHGNKMYKIGNKFGYKDGYLTALLDLCRLDGCPEGYKDYQRCHKYDCDGNPFLCTECVSQYLYDKFQDKLKVESYEENK